MLVSDHEKDDISNPQENAPGNSTGNSLIFHEDSLHPDMMETRSMKFVSPVNRSTGRPVRRPVSKKKDFYSTYDERIESNPNDGSSFDNGVLFCETDILDRVF